MLQKLFLIKHAKPLVNPSQLPELWKLSAEGIEAAKHLASVLHDAGISKIVCSEEVKAIETAEILAEQLRLKHEPKPDLHEHDRSNVPHMRSGEFISHVELFFRRPAERVLGKESADEALERFESAVREVVSDNPGETVAIVSHGTVISLLLASLQGKDNAFDLWRAMQLPSYAVVELPGWKVDSVVTRIE